MTGRFDEATAVLEEAIRHAEAAPADAAARAALVAAPRPPPNRRRGMAPGARSRRRSQATIASSRRRATRRDSRWPGGSSPGRPGSHAGSATPPRRHGTRCEHARRAGDVRQERRARHGYAAAAALGPTLVDEAIDAVRGRDRADGGRPAVGGDRPLGAGEPLCDAGRVRPCALARGARPDRSSRSSGSTWNRRGSGWRRRSIERLAGDLEAAERELRAAYDALDAVGEKFVLSTVAGFLAQTLLERGALEEASALCERSRELTTEADVATQGLWRYVRGTHPRPAGRGVRGARHHPRGARVLSQPTEAIVYQIECHVALGEALAAGGRAGRGATGVRGRASPRRAEGRRRDPHRRTPPARGSRRRPEDDVAWATSPAPGPVRLGAWRRSSRCSGFLRRRDRDDASVVGRRRRRRHIGSRRVVEDLRDLVAVRQRPRPQTLNVNVITPWRTRSPPRVPRRGSSDRALRRRPRTAVRCSRR